MVPAYSPPELFLFAVSVFGLEHFVFGAFRALAFLAFDFRNTLGFFALAAVNLGVQPFDKNAAGEIPVRGLGALFLAFDHEASWQVLDDNTGRNFIDVLAAGATRADKGLLEIHLPDTQPFHGTLKVIILLLRDWK